MYRRHGQKLAWVFLLADLSVTAGVWLGAYFIRFGLWDAPQGVPDLTRVCDALPLVLVSAAIAYRVCGLYEIHRLRQLPRELGVIGQASGLLFLLAATAIFYRRDLYESRLALAVFLALNAAALVVSRRLLWWMLRYLRGRGLNYGRAVIVGSGRVGRRLARTLRRQTWTGLEVIGFIDEPALSPAPLLPLLGRVEELAEVVVRHDIDHVFVALPLTQYNRLPAVYRALSGLLVDVQLAPEVPNLAGLRVRSFELDGQALLSLRENPHRGWAQAAKRTMDVALAVAALAALGPLMLVIAGLVKWTSPGPVLFRQRRASLRGRPFTLYKFRSMRLGAEAATGPVWAQANDPRCTPLGRCLRKYNLDELPQLFNVLRGDMSLVGPRPERSVFIDQFSQHLPSYCQRHQVKAGITGWAQVHGWRGNSSLRRRLEHDLYYVANWSLRMDLKILWLTLWRGFRQPHAY